MQHAKRFRNSARTGTGLYGIDVCTASRGWAQNAHIVITSVLAAAAAMQSLALATAHLDHGTC